jgi:hypothetical protein
MSPTHGIDLSRERPFLTIWTRPRATIRGIVDTDPTYQVIPLALASGVIQALYAAPALPQMGLPLPAVVAIAIVVGSIGGFLCLYAGAWLVRLSAPLVGGRAELRDVRAALAWSMVPLLATFPFWLLRLGVFGNETIFATVLRVLANPSLALLLFASFCVELILQVWTLVVLAKTLGEVQGISAWRALGLSLVLTLVIAVPIAIVAVVAIVLWF